MRKKDHLNFDSLERRQRKLVRRYLYVVPSIFDQSYLANFVLLAIISKID